MELGNGKRIVVFFYNQVLSTRVSFDPGATRNADEFLVNAILPEFTNGSDKSREKYLIIASDGELIWASPAIPRPIPHAFDNECIQRKTYRTNDTGCMAKKIPTHANVQDRGEIHPGVAITGYFDGVRIVDVLLTAIWKAPLRSALNLVAEVVDHVYEQTMESCGVDPSELLDEYVQVLIGRISHDDYVSEKISLDRNKAEYRNAVLFYRAQYERQRMFTSCGWFFDDFDRIEPRNNVKYAAQAICLTQQVLPDLLIRPHN